MLSNDTVEEYGEGIIQHGHYNDRIYLMKLTSYPSANYPHQLIKLAKSKQYGKIFAKVPESAAKLFADAGFLRESIIPRFFSGKEAVILMSLYLDAERKQEINNSEIENVMNITYQKGQIGQLTLLKKPFFLRKCSKVDIPIMAEIYKKVFLSYPFPIYDPLYLEKTMESHVDYFAITVAGNIVSISSAEKDMDNKNAELTDFATLPEWRGNGFAQHLLAQMESEMKKQSIKTAYTIARALSPSMNITFQKVGYNFAGRLRNNTNISGKIESMNVWYKHLDIS